MGAKGNNLPRMKLQNSTAIKEIIYKYGPLSRLDIANALSLTPPTITSNVTRLLNAGLVRECAPDVNAAPVLGRRKVGLTFVADAAYLLGIDCTRKYTALCVVDLFGKLCAARMLPPAGPDYDSFFPMLRQGVSGLLAGASVPHTKIVGAGLGVVGHVDGHAGVLRDNPFGWKDKPLADTFKEQLGLPCRVENFARCRALGEELFSEQPCPDTFAYLYTGGAISCPLVVRGRLVSGGLSAAGDLGSMQVMPGKFLSDIAGEDSITKACAAESFDAVLEAQAKGEPLACQTIDTALEALGAAFANVVALIDPPLVVVDGRIVQSGANRERLLRALQAHCRDPQAPLPPIRFVDFDEYRGAKGAAALAIKKYVMQTEMLERKAESDG